MSRFKRINPLPAVLVTGLLLCSHSALACSACFGKSDSPLADGMNWGIFSLLAVVVSVLGGIAAFAIFLARRAAASSAAAPAAQDELLTSTQKA